MILESQLFGMSGTIVNMLMVIIEKLVTLLCVFVRLLSHLADVRTHSVAGMFTPVLHYWQ